MSNVRKYKMKRLCKIEEKMYGVPLYIYIGTYKQYDAWLVNKYKIGKNVQVNFGAETSRLINNGNCEICIWMPSFEWKISEISTLSHECCHVAFRVCEHVGIKLDYNNQEPFTYLQEYYFYEALKKLHK